MEILRGATAFGLCCILSFPAPLALAQDAAPDRDTAPPQAAPTNVQPPAPATHRPDYISTQLEGDARILHAINRFTFGPRAGDVDAVRRMGPGETGLDKWFDAQLHPESLDESDLDARLAEFPAMQWSARDLMFRMPSPAIIRQAADGKFEIPSSGTLYAVYENQIYRFQMRKAAQAEKQTAAVNQGQAPVPAMQDPAMNTDPAANTMMPAPGQDADQTRGRRARAEQVQADRADADETLISSILALQPEDRVRRLLAMQPAEFDDFIKSLRPAQRAALVAGMSPDLKETVEDLAAPEQTVVKELFAERLARDIYSNAQLQEVMTDFWLNHFNIYLRKNEQMPYYLVSYARDTIRPHALGNFEDLLEAVAHSPAMLVYLDNAQSVGPNSPFAYRAIRVNERRPNGKRQAPEGLNENYARELMELHTLGVNGGYTQADVTQVARVLTGWTVDRPLHGRRLPIRRKPP